MTAVYVWSGMRKNGMFGANALARSAVTTWPCEDREVSNPSMGTPLLLLLLTKVTCSALGWDSFADFSARRVPPSSKPSLHDVARSAGGAAGGLLAAVAAGWCPVDPQPASRTPVATAASKKTCFMTVSISTTAFRGAPRHEKALPARPAERRENLRLRGRPDTLST